MAVGQAKTIPDEYQAKVGRLQGADRFYVKEDGYFAFFDHEYSGHELRNYLKSQFTTTYHSTDGSVLQLSLFSVPYGYQIFSAPTAQSLCSMKLPLPSVGQMMVLDFMQFAGDANISIFASTGGGVTGVSVVKAGTYSALSTILVSAIGLLKLLCETNGTWTVVEYNPSVTLQLAT